MQRRQLEGGGRAQFFLTQIYLNIFPLSVCLFVRLFHLLKYWVHFHVSVSDSFVDKQPLYISTATETEFIVN